ncbi:MAG TPA: 5'/3'-nucleotidase SurE [Elusimicrobiota bacterium]|jgi:5'-nucleotidase|nr:5'/3'-nucleotidase SurE [Elusimicrobiota bacterium]
MAAKRPNILVVNDDGIHGPGLEPLATALRALGDVTVVVPAGERSADSHSLTLHKPLRISEVRPRVYIVNGSPASCARLAILELLKGKRIDLVASGINRGYNLGQDVLYSGTVAGAMEATLLGIPAIAISRGYDRVHAHSPAAYRPAAEFARRLARRVLQRGLPEGVCLNVNVPPVPGGKLRGARVTRLGQRIYDKSVTLRHDPAGNPYFWLMGKEVSGKVLPGSDVEAIQGSRISVSPLQLDSTHTPSLPLLESWEL